jgi:hypothetical protein
MKIKTGKEIARKISDSFKFIESLSNTKALLGSVLKYRSV